MDDATLLREAIRLAGLHSASGRNGPFGALVARGGEVVGRGWNRVVELGDPTAHAEMLALRVAAAAQGDFRLEESTLYVTLEPCAMCCGAIVLARVPRVVYGAPDPKAGMAASLGNLLQDGRLNHRSAVTSGVLADAAADLLRGFFRERRG